MSRARRISKDLRHVAALAGTTAAVVEGAAIATEKARAVGEHLVGDDHRDVAPLDAAATRGRCCRNRKVLVLVVVAVAALIGIAVWQRRSTGEDAEQDTGRDEERFPGSMP